MDSEESAAQRLRLPKFRRDTVGGEKDRRFVKEDGDARKTVIIILIRISILQKVCFGFVPHKNSSSC